MSRQRIVFLHVFIWLFALFANLPFAGFRDGMPLPVIVSNILGFLYLMVVFYLFYLYIAPLFLNRKKLTEFLVISFFVIAIMPFFGYVMLFFSRALFDGTFRHFFKGYSFMTHMSGYYPVLSAAVFGSFFRAIINWFETMNKAAESDRQRVHAELDLLKSKLNPHFLFNTLNNIDSLIRKDPEAASDSLIRLSDIMRYLTYETSAQYVELKREIDYMNNFIELHRIRLRSSDDISIVITGDTGAMISPGLFVPLLENAFKFVSFRTSSPSVEIIVTSEGGIINFQCSNYFEMPDGKVNEKNSGFGLANLKKRLEIVYPGKHHLEFKNEGQRFTVNLEINTNAD
ncbi:MAG: histidine kinase [Bacteroidales bacterium]